MRIIRAYQARFEEGGRWRLARAVKVWRTCSEDLAQPLGHNPRGVEHFHWHLDLAELGPPL
jgi:hypothetical protein